MALGAPQVTLDTDPCSLYNLDTSPEVWGGSLMPDNALTPPGCPTTLKSPSFSRIQTQLEKNDVVPTSSQNEAIARYSVPREVTCSVLKWETVLGSLDRPGQSSLSAGALRYRAWAQSWSSAALAARSVLPSKPLP